MVAGVLWNTSLAPITLGLLPILIGPEMAVSIVAERSIPGFTSSLPEYEMTLLLALFVARSCAIFWYGAFRLSRGKRAPYAETLWLLVICAFVAVWKEPLPPDTRPLFYLCVILQWMAGVVIFTLQRRRQPAWKRKTPE